ncbi:o-succinylbenzoate--CoA ligase [Jeotgalibacillus campisalis]|uniref:o-succinylbenzoate--CoA ligase n=1 Tax=Jeotgalibacillus campisalis TaxID=220754 RepID=UPI0005978EB4|nr:o-succinylbenzoate--CoA ligase [Jeotgalibacillus campisalis]
MNPTSHWLTKRAALTPDRSALSFQGSVWTFSEMLDETVLIARKLQSLHLTDKPVAMLIHNSAKAVFLIHALQKIGVEAVMINPRLQVQEWSFQLMDSGAQCLIVEKTLYDKAVSCREVLPVHNIENIEQRTPSSDSLPQRKRDNCSIMYTSGTTGKPKGVQQSYANHFASAVGAAINLGLDPNDRWLCAVPIFHISGYSILMRSVIYGNHVTLYEKFDEGAVHKELTEGTVTMISVVAAMLSRLLEVKGSERYHPNLRCMLLGGGPAAEHILEKCFEDEIHVYQTYGMTETTSQFATLGPEDSKRKIGSSGKPLFLNEIRIVDKEKNECREKMAGEITVKGPAVMKGYLNRPLANESSFKDGWFYTGDIGYLDEEGFLYVLDRRSDLIISGGENIYPAQVEAELTSHSAVIEAAVIGRKDSEWGEVPVAYVVKSVSSLSEQELMAYCRDRLAGYKVPKEIIWMDKLPRNASNKLLRRELKKGGML